MQYFAIGAGVVAVLSLATAVVMLVLRGRLAVQLARVETEKRQADEELTHLRSRSDELEADVVALSAKAVQLSEQIKSAEEKHAAHLESMAAIYREKEAGLARREAEIRDRIAQLNQEFSNVFTRLAADTLKWSNAQFLQLAEKAFAVEREKSVGDLDARREKVDQLIKPMIETLRRYEEKIGQIEKDRTESFASLGQQMRTMAEAGQLLRTETSRLVRALREPTVRGRYGEMQLKRVAELAGMTAYCDFAEQDSTVDGQGNILRPDMIVKLPSERVVVVDAKTNIQAYLDALQAQTEEEASAALDRYGRNVAEQAAALGKKRYWSQYDGSPEFVVMFVPGDQFLDAALSRQPGLLESAARHNVILASPSTLIALLRAVAVGYKEHRLASEAEELRRLGSELHERASVAFNHVAKLGEAIDRTVDCYNHFVGSYRQRLEPTLRRFADIGVGNGKDLPELPERVARPRLLEGTG